LTELMIAISLSMLLVAGALKLLVHARAALNTAESLATLEERAAFALAALEEDLLVAGFWGLHADSTLLSVPGSLYVHCASRDVSGWALQLNVPVVADNDGFALPCPPNSTAMSGTDTLTLRHASPTTTEARAATIQLQTRQSGGTLFSNGTLPSTDPDMRIYDLNVHAWYIDERSSEGDLPALRRYALVNGGLMQNQEIMPGVEDLQVMFGIDRDADGVIDGFVEPGSEAGGDIRAVRLWLLLRSTRLEPGFIDTEFGTNDGYRRISVERTVWLRNPASA
jgi:type IV pilus assembly protein PilW